MSSKPGTVYAITGYDDYIYYAQIAADGTIGFFKFRSSSLEDFKTVSTNSIMSRFIVSFPSIGRALRSGLWLKLGVHRLIPELNNSVEMAQWPVGELNVSIWRDEEIVKETSVFDPEVQQIEIIQAYDADYHVNDRLQADFEDPENVFEVGGNISRERKIKEMLAEKHQDQPWHQLPADWIYSD
jgi:hypothetical protein